MNNWGGLWRALRERVPDERYVDGAHVITIEPDGDGVAVELEGGRRDRFDVVFGADGYRSRVRTLLHPESAPQFAGYVLWRGNFPESELADRSAWEFVLAENSWVSVGFPGGHAVMYPIPDFDAVGGEGPYRVNWAIYAPTPAGLELEGPSSIPPGEVAAALHADLRALIERHVPPRLQPLFAGECDDVSIQPVYDELVDHYTAGRIALIGDAATLSRPHTGSGATKAIQDAMLIESLGAQHADWDDLLAAYDADRSETGRTLVELGRRIGRDQVECTPPWGEMGADEYAAWAAGTLAGESLYFWGDD